MLTGKIDGMSLRERVMIFTAIAFMLVALTKSLLLDPLLAEQKKISTKVQQQQEKLKEIQAQIEVLQKAKKDIENSPLRSRLSASKQQLAEGTIYLKGLRNNLVEPEKMAELLEQVLKRNGHLRLVHLQTLPVAPLFEKMAAKPAGSTTAEEAVMEPDKQVFKHGVQIIVRGNYLDLLQYLTDLERLPSQMFWGKVEMKVLQHPEVELKLTLYTLSLDKTWLQI
jgi:MSHA biogenesis protein MshJ